ncbi:Alpha/Beta hydrolase protein [Boeremia exigua]|uniref:Alpha/Beta hydrolase protein n=1 Tax=Boeremia exigua TaxID=749465 RepID=UPI001E8CEEAE|nr:Alpha/Beta hydrolase protein [Boeremia exigua]KAH6625501.1 Alpha/Beta hydrolase protein [Boeremia exigua]
MAAVAPVESTAEAEPLIRPPYAPSLLTAVEAFQISPERFDLEQLRSSAGPFSPKPILQAMPDIEHVEHSVPGLNKNDPPVTLSVFRSKSSSNTKRAGVYSIHGGAQIACTRGTALDFLMGLFIGIDTVFIAPEYRLSPEHPAPAALHDSYAGLLWAVEHADELGLDPSRIIIHGNSGGAPIACGMAMMCRDDKKVNPLALVLFSPMLDDRDCTTSSKQFAHDGPWCGTINRMAWDMVLGDKRGGSEVSELVAPARATDLRGMPQTFIDVGDSEIFRDESVAFASQLWKSGVQCELHVWPGGFHGFDILSSYTQLARNAANAKAAWVQRIFSS